MYLPFPTKNKDMNVNLKSLIQACDELGVSYTISHSTQEIVELSFQQSTVLFVNSTTPLNSESVVRLCFDKEFFYHFFHNTIRMPKTVAFCKPDWDKYLEFVKEKSYAEIVNSIEKSFQYPLIVKKNRGSRGINIFKANDRNSLLVALKNIFNQNSYQFDYLALAQDYINIQTEYRVIYLNGSLMFAYEKNLENAIYDGNLSPLHWKNAQAILVNDNDLLAEIDRFCVKLFQKMMIPFCGLDIAIDKQGIWWLIEANTAPSFKYFIQACGNKEVIHLYKKIIKFMGMGNGE